MPMGGWAQSDWHHVSCPPSSSFSMLSRHQRPALTFAIAELGLEEQRGEVVEQDLSAQEMNSDAH